MKRTGYFVYGVTGHLLFLAVYAWMAGFVGGILVPHTIDWPAPTPAPLVAAIDLGLLALFALQHSVMARPAIKRAWSRLVPQPVERSTYVCLSCAVVALLMSQWRGLGPVVWDVHHPTARALLWGLFAAGWLMVPAVSFMISSARRCSTPGCATRSTSAGRSRSGPRPR